jgi:UDP-N-acetyl-D-galactosamine dehydrogenase
VLVLGLTFKENVPDIRNTRVVDILAELKSYGIEPLVHDPHADADETRHEYGLELTPLDGLAPVDAVIFAVAHAAFNAFTPADFAHLCNNGHGCGVVIDVKSQLDRAAIENTGLIYWAL